MADTPDTVASLTMRARQLGLAGDFAAAHALLDRAGGLAESGDAALASCAIERGRLHNTAGSPKLALPLFLDAWQRACVADRHSLAVDAAHMVAIVSEADEAVAWTRTALNYVAAHPGTEHWRGPLYNNLGWTLFEAERFEEALPMFEEGARIREAAGQAQPLKIARHAVIHTLRALGRFDEAIALGATVVAEADASGDVAPFVCEEMAECYAQTGDAARARAHAGRALAVLAGDAAFRQTEPKRYERLGELAS